MKKEQFMYATRIGKSIFFVAAHGEDEARELTAGSKDKKLLAKVQVVMVIKEKAYLGRERQWQNDISELLSKGMHVN